MVLWHKRHLTSSGLSTSTWGSAFSWRSRSVRRQLLIRVSICGIALGEMEGEVVHGPKWRPTSTGLFFDNRHLAVVSSKKERVDGFCSPLGETTSAEERRGIALVVAVMMMRGGEEMAEALRPRPDSAFYPREVSRVACAVRNSRINKLLAQLPSTLVLLI